MNFLRRRDKNMKKKYTLMTIIVLLLIVIDQIIKEIVVRNKIVIMSSEKIGYIQNFGGAFGLGGNSTIFIILVNIVVLGIIIKFVYSQKDRIDINQKEYIVKNNCIIAYSKYTIIQ